jgi:hypothetical protein
MPAAPVGGDPRGIERSETGGGDPDGPAGGAGGSARRGIDLIEQRITELVQRAPEIEAGGVDDVIDDLIDALRGVGSPLALAIARIVELIAEQLVDPGIALPPLAMACATLAAGMRGALGDRELEAARYEIDTLQPTPDPPARVILPHVPLTALLRRRS